MIAIIPAYEPDEQLVKTAEELNGLGFKLIIVNDGSSPDKDDIFGKAESFGVVLHHEKNCGKGRALKTAMQYILENMPDEDSVVTVDADGQHRSQDVIAVSLMLSLHPNDLILGVRSFEGKVPLRSRIGNSVTRTVFALASGKKLSDTQTGLRAFSTEMIPFLLSIEGERYEYEMNMLLSCAESGISWTEVPIRTVYRDMKNSTSHFNTVKDSFRIYKTILKFSGSSFLSFLLDYFLFNVFNAVFGLIPFFNAVFFSNIFARVISCMFNYGLNKKYVFRSGGGTATAVKYFCLALGILIANTVLLQAFTAVGIPAFAAKIFTEITLFVCSLLVQRFVIFKNVKRS